jgi:ABC-type uncharacterized transport system permease subunit
MLVFIPEIDDLSNRGLFVLIIVCLLTGLLVVHRKLIPNTVIFLARESPGTLARIWPSIFSWLIAVSSAIVALLVITVPLTLK